MQREVKTGTAWPRITSQVLLAAIGFALTVIPPAFVYLDRWLDDPALHSLADEWRVSMCSVEFLCRTVLPGYFPVIPACFLGLIVLFAATAPALRGLFLPGADALAGPPPVPAAESAAAPAAGRPASIPSAWPAAADRVDSRQRLAGYVLQIAAVLGFTVVALVSAVLNRLPGAELLAMILAYLAGCCLAELPLLPLSAALKRLPDWALPLILVEAALVALLRSIYVDPGGRFLSGMLLLLALGLLGRSWRRVPAVGWMVLLAQVALTVQINSYTFSVIGDEYDFFSYAREILTQFEPSAISSHLFAVDGVYGTHPFFSSMIQAASMGVLGTNNFGWRFSSLSLAAFSLPFFYLFFKNFFSRRIALLSTLLLAVSHYLMTFGKIGYNNLQALFVLSLGLGLGGQAVRTRRPLYYALLGLALGLCFYVYPAAVYTFAPVGLLLLFFDPPTSRGAVGRWLRLALPLGMLAAPLLFQPKFFETMVSGTTFHNSSLVGAQLAYNLGSNLIYSLFSFVYAAQESHFVVASYVDVISSALVPLGLAWTIKLARREKAAGYWLTSFLVMVVAVGVTAGRDYPSATRMFMLLPWLCSLAAAGLVWLGGALACLPRRAVWAAAAGLGVFAATAIGITSYPLLFAFLLAVLVAAVLLSLRPLREASTPSRIANGLVVVLAAAIIGTNFYQAYSLSPRRRIGQTSVEILFLRLQERARDQGILNEPDYLFLTAPNWGITGIQRQSEVYQLPPDPHQLHRVALEGSTLPAETAAFIRGEDTLVIVQPWLDPPILEGLFSQLAGLDKQPCAIRDAPTKDPTMVLWISPKYEQFCPKDGDWSVK